MKVKLITIYAGPRGTYGAGDVADFSDEEARALIDGRHAEEYAEVLPPETASLAGGKGGGATEKALTPAQENRKASAAVRAAAKKAVKAKKAEKAERA